MTNRVIGFNELQEQYFLFHKKLSNIKSGNDILQAFKDHIIGATAYTQLVNSYGTVTRAEKYEVSDIDAELDIVDISMRWSDNVSNSHSAPHNGVTNWDRDKEQPLGYPGWHGTMTIRLYGIMHDGRPIMKVRKAGGKSKRVTKLYMYPNFGLFRPHYFINNSIRKDNSIRTVFNTGTGSCNDYGINTSVSIFLNDLSDDAAKFIEQTMIIAALKKDDDINNAVNDVMNVKYKHNRYKLTI